MSAPVAGGGVDVLAVIKRARDDLKARGQAFTAENAALAAVADLIAERDRLQARLDTTRCNSGHETLPLTLWDCPECHNETKRKLAELIAADKEYDEAMAQRERIDGGARFMAAKRRRAAALSNIEGGKA